MHTGVSPTPGFPWDELAVELTVLDEALYRPRVCLPDVVNVTRSAGIYLLFYATDEPVPCLRPVADGTYPVYVGSATNLRDRLGRHRRYCQPVPRLSGGADLHALYVETPSHGSSLYCEALVDRLRPVFNHVLTGFGSKPQGAKRTTQRMNAFSVLFPGRVVGSGAPGITSARLERQVACHLDAYAHPGLWPLVSASVQARAGVQAVQALRAVEA